MKKSLTYKIDEVLTRGVEKIYPSKEVLNKVLLSGKKLRLYQGFDPSGIQLHIGHLAGLMKLAQFQKLGHHIIFLIGDGTGQAGDPSGKTRSREKYLTREQLRQNAKDYVLQAKKIINFEGANSAEILYNGDWLNKMTLVDILSLAGHFSLQQLEERDIFEKRKKEGQKINFREFLYPLLQGYDSVAMNVDLEIGGSDQTFNMLTGRKLVREYLHKEKFVLTTVLLTDKTGKKIGKTEGNVIALVAKPEELYGMIMNLPDNIILKCFEMITDIPIENVKKYKKELDSGVNPMIYKKKLAYTLVKILNGKTAAQKAQNYFETVFQKRQTPAKLPELKVTKNKKTIINLLVELGLALSKSSSKQLVKMRAVDINGQTVIDPQQMIIAESGTIIKVGKHKIIKLIVD